MNWLQKLFNKWFNYEYVVMTSQIDTTSVVRVRILSDGSKYVPAFGGGMAFLLSDGKVKGPHFFNGDYVSWRKA